MNTPERTLHDYVAEVSERTEVRMGVPLPMGTHEDAGAVNFAFFSRHASRARLELFDQPEDATPARVIEFDPARNRTGDVWHVWVEGIRPGQLYAYRVDGPYKPSEGHRFNFNRLLLDPFATAISPLADWDFGQARGYDASAPERDLVRSNIDDTGAMPKCVFTQEHFDWHEDHPLRHPWPKTVIYETHVRGFTIHPTSGVEHPGTYRGLIEKIPYLKTLGATAVELMPVYEFNESQVPGINPQTGKPLGNYWGYDPVAFFAPKASYSSAGGLRQQKLEFKEMVQALHRAGIEIILDVVFNHTDWFNPHMGLPNWADPKEQQFACLIHENDQSALYLMFNAGADAAVFGLPPAPLGTPWHLAADTDREAPRDLFADGEESLWEDPYIYRLSPRSSAILLARGTKDGGGNEAAPVTQAIDPAQSIAGAVAQG